MGGSCPSHDHGPNQSSTGNCFIDPEIKQLKDSNPSEAIDTGFIQLTFENGGNVTINVCRRATYGTSDRPTVRRGVGRTTGWIGWTANPHFAIYITKNRL